MQFSKVHKALSGKAGMVPFERNRHTEYRYASSGAVKLPKLLTISRGSGEISKRNFNGLSSNVGMQFREFERFCSCSVSASLFTISIASGIFLNVWRDYLSCPDVYAPKLSRLISASKLVLKDLNNSTEKDFSVDDKKLANRLHKLLRQPLNHTEADDCRLFILTYVDRILADEIKDSGRSA